MRIEYQTYEEVKRSFTSGERWQVFDGNRSNFNIAHECVDRHPKDKIAVRIKFDSGKRAVYTFGELSRFTSQFAHMLHRLGVKAGDCVALVADPSLEFYTGFFGTLKAGAVVVPCSPLFGPEAIEYRVSRSNARLVADKQGKGRPG